MKTNEASSSNAELDADERIVELTQQVSQLRHELAAREAALTALAARLRELELAADTARPEPFFRRLRRTRQVKKG